MRSLSIVGECLLLCWNFAAVTADSATSTVSKSASSSSSTMASNKSMEMDVLSSFLYDLTMNGGGRNLLDLDVKDRNNKEQQQQSTTTRSLQVTEENGGVKYTKCEDISEIYRRAWNRRFNGTNLLTTYYDCECTDILPVDDATSTDDYYQGELGTILMSCGLKTETHCYNFIPYDIVWRESIDASLSGNEFEIDPDNHDDSVEVCLKHSMDITVWVNTTTTTAIVAPGVKESKVCTEFVKGGPQQITVPTNGDDEKAVVGPGTYCHIHAPICYDVLYEDLDYDSQSTITICNDRPTCLEFFQQEVGYTNGQALAMCPMTKLNDQECAVSFNSYASSNTSCAAWDAEANAYDGVYINYAYALATLADCTNVLPCAKPICAISPATDAKMEDRFWIYPDCINHTIELPGDVDNDSNDGDDNSGGFVLERTGKTALTLLMAILFLFYR